MKYDKYEAKVVKKAQRKLKGKPVCIDNVKDFWNRNEKIKDCVDDVVFTTMFYDGFF